MKLIPGRTYKVKCIYKNCGCEYIEYSKLRFTGYDDGDLNFGSTGFRASDCKIQVSSYKLLI